MPWLGTEAGCINSSKERQICPSDTFFFPIKSLNELEEAHSISGKIISSILSLPIQMPISSTNTLKVHLDAVLIGYL